MDFPERIYTSEEVAKARKLIQRGYRHQLKAEGSPDFRDKTRRALSLVKLAGYNDFLRKHIRRIVEIDGLTQLREADATIWANKYAVQDPVDAASLFVQKANHMKEYLEAKLYFGGAAETRSVRKRIEFLEALKRKSSEREVKEDCERLLKSWYESVFF